MYRGSLCENNRALFDVFGQVPEWPNGADCKSAGSRLREFESLPAHQMVVFGIPEGIPEIAIDRVGLFL